jgi:hypothetical protein
VERVLRDALGLEGVGERDAELTACGERFTDIAFERGCFVRRREPAAWVERRQARARRVEDEPNGGEPLPRIDRVATPKPDRERAPAEDTMDGSGPVVPLAKHRELRLDEDLSPGQLLDHERTTIRRHAIPAGARRRPPLLREFGADDEHACVIERGGPGEAAARGEDPRCALTDRRQDACQPTGRRVQGWTPLLAAGQRVRAPMSCSWSNTLARSSRRGSLSLRSTTCTIKPSRASVRAKSSRVPG